MPTGIYWLDTHWPGRLGIAPRPRGGDWLADDVRAWRAAGIDVIVSLITPEEIAEFQLLGEEALCRKHDIAFHAFPIQDRGIPSSRNSFIELLAVLQYALLSGKNVGAHCRQGIGRSSLVVAVLLIKSSEAPDHAFAKIECARGRAVPDTEAQRRWIEELFAAAPCGER